MSRIEETTKKVFEYRNESDIKVWGEPVSPERWNRILKEIGGVCPLGDARLRIVWAATEMKDGYVQTPTGSIPVRVIKYPNQPFSKLRSLKGFFYYANDGKRYEVARADQAPKGRLTYPIYDYIELGALRWYLERKFTVEELVAMDMRPDPTTEAGRNYGVQTMNGITRRHIAPVNPRGEYIGLFPLQTPEGDYFEPDDAWFDLLRKTQYEVTNEDKDRLLAETFAAMEKAEKQRTARENEELLTHVEDAIIEVQNEPLGLVHFDLKGNH